MIKYFINRYREYGIAKKILIILLFGSIVPVILIELITCGIAANTLRRQTDILVESNMKLSQKGLEDYFSEYDGIIMSIYTENEYAMKLEKLNVWDSRNYFMLKRQLEDDLENISYLHPEILGIAVVTRKKECIIYDSITNSSLDSYCFPEKDKSWLTVAEETFHNTQTVYSGVMSREQADGVKRNIIYLGHRIADINNYRQGTVGSILICLDEENIRDAYSQENEDKVNVSFLCDAGGNIISSIRRIIAPLMFPGICVVFIFTFSGSWGNFFIPYILLQTLNKFPASVTLYQFFGQHGMIVYGQLAAYSAVYAVPSILLYVLSQNYMSKGFYMAGAAKG